MATVDTQSFYKGSPSAGDGTLTIKRNGTVLGTFTAKQSWDTDVDITVPVRTSQLDNDSGFVSDQDYVHTDNNFTDELHSKLEGVESGAQVNVQADWNQTDTSAQDYIKNKPLSRLLPETALSDGGKILTVNSAGTGTEWRSTDDLKAFKGWFDSSSALSAAYPSPKVGDYAYIKGATATDPAVIYECATAGTWSDSERTVDTSSVQTFATGEEVINIAIDDTQLVNPADGALPMAADVMQLKAKLSGVTASETKVQLVTSGEGQNVYDGLINGETGAYNRSSYNKFIVVPLNGANSVRWLGKENVSNSSKLGWAFGTFSGEIDATLSTFTALSKGVYANNPLDNQAVEYIQDVPDNATHVVITIWIYRQNGGSAVTMNNFYCYLQSGESVGQKLEDLVIDNLESSSVTNALSSNQGRILKGMVENLNADVFGGDKFLEIIGELDLAFGKNGTYAYFSTGTYKYLSGYGYKSYYYQLATPSSDNDVYLRVYAGVHKCLVTLLSTTDGLLSSGTPSYSSVMNNTTYIKINANEFRDIKLSNDCAYVVFYNRDTSTPDGYYMPSSCKYVTKEVVESKITQSKVWITHIVPENEGQLNAVKRMRKFSDIEYTPAFEFSRLSSGGGASWFRDKFLAGVTYKGIPYSRSYYKMADYGYKKNNNDITGFKIGFYISLDTFITAISNRGTVMELESVFSHNSSNHNSSFYSNICAGCVSAAL